MELSKNFTSLIIGKNGSGKTHLIKYIIKKLLSKNEIENIIIFSNTADMSGDFEFLRNKINEKKAVIFDTINFDKRIYNIMNIIKNNKNKKLNQTLIIFDDIMGYIKNSKNFAALSSQQRHFNISIIFSIQFITKVEPYYREIATYIFIFNQNTKKSLVSVYENYFQHFNNYSKFLEYFKVLKEYEFFFIDNKKNIIKKLKCPA